MLLPCLIVTVLSVSFTSLVLYSLLGSSDLLQCRPTAFLSCHGATHVQFLTVHLHVQFATCKGQACLREVRCVTCTSYTNSQWATLKAWIKAYKRKVSIVSFYVGGSLLVMSTVQAEV